MMKELWKKIVAVICVFSMMIAGIGGIPEVRAEEVPTELTYISWSDVGITGDTTIVYNEAGYGTTDKNIAEKSVVNSSFRGVLKFNKTAGQNMWFQYGSNLDNLVGKGIRFTLTDEGTLKVYDMVNEGIELAEITANAVGLTSGTFLNTDFELGIDLWQPSSSSEDMKLNVYINGNKYNDSSYIISGGASKMLNCIDWMVGGSNDSIDIIVEEATPELTSISWSDLGITENTTIQHNEAGWGTTDKNIAEKSVVNSSFRGMLKFQKTAGQNMWFQYGSNLDHLGEKGIRFTLTDEGTLKVYDMVNEGIELAEITANAVGLTSGTFLNTDFELGIDLWQPSSSSEDMKLNVYINGNKYNDSSYIISGGASRMLNCIDWMVGGSSDSIDIIVDAEPSPEDLAKIGWKDFGLSGQDYAYTSGGFSVLEHCNTVTLKNASFRGVVQFKGTGTKLTYGDNWDGWEHGLNFAPTEEGKLKVWNALDRTNLDVALDPSEVGIASFLNQEFELGIDSWADGNDIKFNIFVNGQQYNQSAYIWKDGVQNQFLYPYMTVGLLISGADDSITVELPVEESCNLDTTPDGYLLNGSNVRVNDNAAAGAALTTVGDYHVLYVDENGVTAKDVGCYKRGDAHVDDTIDIRDVVATEKVVTDQNVSSVARKKAADVNEDTLYNDEDKEAIFNMILGVSTDTPNVASYSLTEDAQEMPIGGFNGPYCVSDRDLITDDVYKKIADCGINFITFTKHSYPTDSNDTENIEITQKQLALAEKYDLGFFVQDHHIQYSTQKWTTEELANRIKLYSNYKSFRGLAIFDEPTLAGVYGSSDDGAGDAFNTRKSVSKLANSFSNIAAYANMLPLNMNMKLDTSVTDEDAYRTYLTTYCEEYHPKFLSYDNYPFEWSQDAMKGTSGKADYYYFKNLAIVREIANQYQIPFWTHVQSGDYFDQNAGYENRHNPSEEKFKWQINVELAFGAKGIQYFPLVQPDGYEMTESGTTDYTRNGLIGKDGYTTEWYTYAQEMNQQIKNIDHVLMNSVSKGIMADGGYASANMNQANESSNILLTEFDLGGVNPKITTLTTTGTTYGAIAGCFDYQRKAAVYVVNYDVEQAQNVTLGWNKSCSYKVLDRNGETAKEPATECTLALGAGEAALLVFE